MLNCLERFDQSGEGLENYNLVKENCYLDVMRTMCTLSIPLGYGGLIPQGPGGSIPLD
jgi:hypothetical protein